MLRCLPCRKRQPGSEYGCFILINAEIIRERNAAGKKLASIFDDGPGENVLFSDKKKFRIFARSLSGRKNGFNMRHPQKDG